MCLEKFWQFLLYFQIVSGIVLLTSKRYNYLHNPYMMSCLRKLKKLKIQFCCYVFSHIFFTSIGR